MRTRLDHICALCREWTLQGTTTEQRTAGIGLCASYRKPMYWNESSPLFAQEPQWAARQQWIENFTREKNGK